MKNATSRTRRLPVDAMRDRMGQIETRAILATATDDQILRLFGRLRAEIDGPKQQVRGTTALAHLVQDELEARSGLKAR